MTINEECFSCPKAIFQPSLIQSDSDAKMHMHGLHEMCYYTIMKCNVDLREDMYGNVVLSGGTAAGWDQQVLVKLWSIVLTKGGSTYLPSFSFQSFIIIIKSIFKNLWINELLIIKILPCAEILWFKIHPLHFLVENLCLFLWWGNCKRWNVEYEMEHRMEYGMEKHWKKMIKACCSIL